MRAHPLLNVGDVTLDPELLDKVPHNMALYYMALPLAREDGQVSVAMAHPENTTALGVLSNLLGGPVVAVRDFSHSIRARLDTLRTAPTPPEPTVLGWCTRPRPEGSQVLAVVAWAKLLGAALGASTRLLETTQATFEDDFSAFSAEPQRLIVLNSLPDPARANVLRQAKGPLFFVRGQGDADENGMNANSAEVASLRRILVVLRGYSSDEQALEWAATLAADTQARLVILPLTGGHVSALQEFFSGRDNTNHLHTSVKVRQGAPLVQIVDEAAVGDYDLLIVSAEGEGAFVGQVLAELERRDAHNGRPVLILKPTL